MNMENISKLVFVVAIANDSGNSLYDVGKGAV